jgi:hypothetical protein
MQTTMRASTSRAAVASNTKLAATRSFVRANVTRASRARAVSVRAAAPLVGSAAPDFKATAVFDQEFMDITLSQYKGKYVVLFFYPLDFTFGKCVTHHIDTAAVSGAGCALPRAYVFVGRTWGGLGERQAPGVFAATGSLRCAPDHFLSSFRSPLAAVCPTVSSFESGVLL